MRNKRLILALTGAVICGLLAVMLVTRYLASVQNYHKGPQQRRGRQDGDSDWARKSLRSSWHSCRFPMVRRPREHSENSKRQWAELQSFRSASASLLRI